MTAILTSTESLAAGTATWLSLRPERLVLFDTGTGQALANLSAGRGWQLA